MFNSTTSELYIAEYCASAQRVYAFGNIAAETVSGNDGTVVVAAAEVVLGVVMVAVARHPMP